MAEETQKLIAHKSDHEDAQEKYGFGTDSKLKETGVIIIILIIRMLSMMIDLMPVPFFTYEAKERGLVEFQTGIIFGCYDLARFVVSPWGNMMIKRFSAKGSFILGATMCGISCVVFGLGGYCQHPVLLFVLSMVMRLISGIGAAMISVSGTSIAMMSKSYTNTTIFGWLKMASGVALMGGYLIGGGLYELLGYSPMFIGMGGVVILACIPGYFFVPNITEIEETSHKGILDMMRIPPMIIMVLVCVVGQFSMYGKSTLITDWMVTTFDLSVSVAILAYVPGLIAYTVCNYLSSWATNKGFVYSTFMVNWVIFILCFLLMCPAPFLLPLFNNRLYLAVTIALSALGAGNLAFLYVPLFKIIHSLTVAYGHDGDSLHTYSRISGLMESGFALGAMLGPPTTGLLTMKLSYPWSVTFCAFMNITLFTVFGVMLVILKCRGTLLNCKHNQKPSTSASE